MREMSIPQREQMVQLLEITMNNDPIPDDLLVDKHVVAEFIRLSLENSLVLVQWFKAGNVKTMSQLTLNDVLTEELLLKLHIEHGFSIPEVAQWLCGLNYDAMMFFIQQCREKNVMYVEEVFQQARSTYRMIDGVYIESVTVHFKDILNMLTYVINRRFTNNQFQNMLLDFSPTSNDIIHCVSHLIDDHKVLNHLVTKDQIHVFRIFCMLLSYIKDNNQYLMGVANVFDRLLDATSVEKTVTLLNTMPYIAIEFVIKRWIAKQQTDVTTLLAETLPEFKFGSIRKIVRRGQLGVDYSYG